MNCKNCDKSDCEFYARNKYTCKECVKIQSMSWKRANLDRRRDTQNKFDWKKRGINDLEKARLIKQEIKNCSICGIDKNLQLDHCHETGNVRSMLCGKCNRGLGIFGDNPELFKKALNYLNLHAA